MKGGMEAMLPRALLLKLPAQDSTRDLLKMQILVQGGLGRVLRVSSSTKLPGDVNAASPELGLSRKGPRERCLGRLPGVGGPAQSLPSVTTFSQSQPLLHFLCSSLDSSCPSCGLLQKSPDIPPGLSCIFNPSLEVAQR